MSGKMATNVPLVLQIVLLVTQLALSALVAHNLSKLMQVDAVPPRHQLVLLLLSGSTLQALA
jgi:hypothetical protein